MRPKFSAQGTPKDDRKEARGRPRLSAERLGLDPLSVKSDMALHDQVYEALCRAIMMGAVSPQQQLSVRSLAVEFGVSATPVKEALRRLGADGVLFALPKSSFRVTEMTAKRYAELIEIRKRLEGYAAEQACRQASHPLIERLTALNELFLSSKGLDSSAMLDLNMEFHFTLYSAAQQPDLLEIIRGLWLRIGPYLSYYDKDDTQLSYRTHAKIIKALRTGKPEAASAAICSDLEQAAGVILKKLSDPELTRTANASTVDVFRPNPSSRLAPPKRVQ